MTAYGLPVLFALFAWWFSTGAILYLDGLPQRTFRWSMLGATIVLGLSVWGIAISAEDTSVTGAYIAFTSALLVWGWQEISFYMGYVTGPRTTGCPEHCTGWRHFVHGVSVCLWHEISILIAAAVVAALTWRASNQIGLWTFVVLWWMHESAKLNVFFGVRNLNEQFLPDHLAYLRSYLTRKPMNPFFPVSVTVSTAVAAVLIERAVADDVSAFDAVGYTFLAAMMVLAIVEHWFLVLPLPFAELWNWAMISRRKLAPEDGPSRGMKSVYERMTGATRSATHDRRPVPVRRFQTAPRSALSYLEDPAGRPVPARFEACETGRLGCAGGHAGHTHKIS